MAYATAADLGNWLDPKPLPDNPGKVLELASDDIDELLTGAWYDVDADGMPTAPDVITALRDACVRQAEWLLDRDDLSGAQSDVQSMTVGGRSLTRRTVGSGAGAAPQFSPRAVVVLRRAGLLALYPLVVG